MSTIAITSDLLEVACACCGYPIPKDEIVFFGVRGALPASAASTSFSQSQVLRFEEIDYRNMRCTIGQWNTAERSVATYPGSTVPSLPSIASAKERGGAGANMLLPGRYEYERGQHKNGKPSGHRAFRQASFFPVRRTRNNTSYDAFDDIDFGSSSGDFVWDNLHSAYSASLASYSSAGCQVVCGLPASASRGNQPETGPWRDFIHVAYELFGNQKRYTYLLFTAEELSALATAAPGALRQVVRFGSVGQAARMVQEALIQSGDLADAADGDFGRKSLMALVKYQSRMFPRGAVDGVCGPNTLNALNIQLPVPSRAPADLAAPAAHPTVPESDIDDETDMSAEEIQRVLALLGIGQAPPLQKPTSLPPSSLQTPPRTFDFDKFVQTTRSGPFSGLPSQAQSEGMRPVIDAFFRSYPDGDPRWLAYILATIFHETGRMMVPVREGFAKTDAGARTAVKKMFDQGRISRDYAIPDPVTGLSYFGRGRVQNTHKSNYAKLSERFNRDFVNQPELLLDSTVDAEVSVIGHVEGIWTTRKLSDFIGNGRCDYREARRIVNGTDKADQIAAYARQFENAIDAALTPGSTVTNSASTSDPQQGDTSVREEIIASVLDVLRQRQDDSNSSMPTEMQSEQITEALRNLAGLKAPLTPVNAALGEGLGRLLDGKKSIIGIGGAVLAAIAGNGGSSVAPIVEAVTKAVPLLTGLSGTSLPIFVAIAAWGLLGKVEKMIKSNRLR